MPTMQPLTVPGDLASLKAVRDYVTTAAGQAGLDRVLANRLRLAVDEIVTNSIVHGYNEAGIEGEVRIQGEIEGNKLTITVEDEGKFYDPTEHQLPDEGVLGAPLDTREIGGLGIYLAIHSIDEFRFERDGHRNRNIFVVYRPPVEASA